MKGDELVEVLAVLANPHRLRILAALTEQSDYVSRLARTVGISRPLLQMHLRRLEAVGLVSAHMELSEDGKAMNFYRVEDFALELTPSTVHHLAASLSPAADTAKTPPRLSRKDADT